MNCNNPIWQKRHSLCKREGNKSRWDAGFSPSWVCHDAGSSIPACRYLLGDAPISSFDFMLTVTYPTYFIYLYMYGLCWWNETFMSIIFLLSNGIYSVPFLGMITDTSTNTVGLSSLEHGRIHRILQEDTHSSSVSAMMMPMIKKWILLWFFTTREGFVAIFLIRMTTLALIGAMVVLCYPTSGAPFPNNFHLSMDR